jgi:myosin heavy subunit
MTTKNELFIFYVRYQLLQVAAPEEVKTKWESLANSTTESFAFVGTSNTNTIEGKPDSERFNLVARALNLGIEGDLWLSLMRCICVVPQ